MEDDLKKIKNGKQPKKYKTNGRQPKKKKKEDDLKQKSFLDSS
jgi:hypothetical protein